MKWLTREVSAAIEGIHDAAPGAEVLILDGHGPGGLDFDEIHPDAQVFMHSHSPSRDYLLDETFNGLLFIGQHAMAGTLSAPLCHTYSSRTVEYYKLNGQPIGEISCRAALAGSFGVPTIGRLYWRR